jgi:hypothetical protein
VIIRISVSESEYCPSCWVPCRWDGEGPDYYAVVRVRLDRHHCIEEEGFGDTESEAVAEAVAAWRKLRNETRRAPR